MGSSNDDQHAVRNIIDSDKHQKEVGFKEFGITASIVGRICAKEMLEKWNKNQQSQHCSINQLKR